MRTHLRRAVCAGVMTGGFTVLGLALATSPAAADDTSGQGGLLSGNQSGGQVNLPIHIGGHQVTVLGNDNSGSGGSSGGSTSGSTSGGTTDGSGGTGSGNQSSLGVNAPVDVSGNQVTVIGDGNRDSSTFEGQGGSGSASQPATFQGTGGQDGTVSGNQSAVGVSAPVTLCGNQVTVIGDGNEAGACQGGAATDGSGSAGDASTTGEDGAGSGNQTWLSLLVPADATGNQVTVIGDDNQSSSQSSADSAGTGSSATGTTSGEDGTGSGNQTDAGATTPVDATGNQVTVIGDGNQSQSEGTGTAGTSGTPTGDQQTDGTNGTGSGNQTDPAATAPVDATGNQVTVIGDGNQSEATTGSGSTGAPAADQQTDGTNGTGSGNQTDPAVEAPVDAGDNQVTVLGDGNTTRAQSQVGEVVDPTGPQGTEDGGDGTTGNPGGTAGTPGSAGEDGSQGQGSQGQGSQGQGSQGAAILGNGSLPQELPQQLPSTGAAAGLLWLILLGLLLVGAGLVLTVGRRGRRPHPAPGGGDASTGPEPLNPAANATRSASPADQLPMAA